ncbi:hypothetical protein DR999_PMT20383 [Platysternon megacephalum]|uniref:Uncharacterized protein n=1 Tax=Platysternon megacephalum TaxID=55544 RepID=A0A4D9DJT4_9SAUR|nr:hypothetical protein DR999_PMT20383 [Platysternon megacephalum]
MHEALEAPVQTAKDLSSSSSRAHRTYPFYKKLDQVLSRVHDPLLNHAGLILQEDTDEDQGEEAARTVEDTPEDSEDEEHVILHLYLEEQVEEAPSHDELRKTPSCVRNQNLRLISYNAPSLFSRISLLALVLNSQF